MAGVIFTTCPTKYFVLQKMSAGTICPVRVMQGKGPLHNFFVLFLNLPAVEDVTNAATEPSIHQDKWAPLHMSRGGHSLVVVTAGNFCWRSHSVHSGHAGQR